MDIGEWLRSLDLGRYEQAFRDNDIGERVLPELTAEDLIGLGVTSTGHRRTLLAAIGRMRPKPASALELSARAERTLHERRYLIRLISAAQCLQDGASGRPGHGSCCPTRMPARPIS